MLMNMREYLFLRRTFFYKASIVLHNVLLSCFVLLLWT